MTGSDRLTYLASGWELMPTAGPFGLAEKEAMPATAPGTSGLPLPPPEIPVRKSVRENDGPVTFTPGHHFTAAGSPDPRALAEAASAPLSVILQVTKRCDFGCVFCSETLLMPDPTLDQLDVIRANLAGVQRVFLSGGEPLLRRDLPEIVDSVFRVHRRPAD